MMALTNEAGFWKDKKKLMFVEKILRCMLAYKNDLCLRNINNLLKVLCVLYKIAAPFYARPNDKECAKKYVQIETTKRLHWRMILFSKDVKARFKPCIFFQAIWQECEDCLVLMLLQQLLKQILSLLLSLLAMIRKVRGVNNSLSPARLVYKTLPWIGTL